jgi:hypothetical protein
MCVASTPRKNIDNIIYISNLHVYKLSEYFLYYTFLTNTINTFWDMKN